MQLDYCITFERLFMKIKKVYLFYAIIYLYLEEKKGVDRSSTVIARDGNEGSNKAYIFIKYLGPTLLNDLDFFCPTLLVNCGYHFNVKIIILLLSYLTS